MILGPLFCANFTRDYHPESRTVLVKLAATRLGGNVRRTKYLENTSRHKMRDTERNRCETDYSKSK